MKNCIKKTLIVLLIINILLPISFGFSQDNEIKVIIYGIVLNSDVKPVSINGRTMVPLRAIFEALGATVEWEGTTKTITGIKDNIVVVLKQDSVDATVNDEHIILDVPATAINGRTMVPVRFIAESLEKHVAWNSELKTVNISDNPIIEWKYGGYEKDEPYREYEIQYIDGVKTETTRYTGKNHEFKKINLYSLDGRIIENVLENKISVYGSGWLTKSPFIEKTYWVKKWIFSINAMFSLTDLSTGKLLELEDLPDDYYIKIIIDDHKNYSENKDTQYPVFLATINKTKVRFSTSSLLNLEKEDYNIFQENPKEIFKWSDSIWNKINKDMSIRENWIGMTYDMAIVMRGRPNEINRSTGSWGTKEQWVYTDSNGIGWLYLYFKNGKLTSWQD